MGYGAILWGAVGVKTKFMQGYILRGRNIAGFHFFVRVEMRYVGTLRVGIKKYVGIIYFVGWGYVM